MKTTRQAAQRFWLIWHDDAGGKLAALAFSSVQAEARARGDQRRSYVDGIFKYHQRKIKEEFPGFDCSVKFRPKFGGVEYIIEGSRKSNSCPRPWK